LCETKFPTYFIKDETEILSENLIQHFDLHKKELIQTQNYLEGDKPVKIILTSGASCPDATVDRVIQKLISYFSTSLILMMY